MSNSDLLMPSICVRKFQINRLKISSSSSNDDGVNKRSEKMQVTHEECFVAVLELSRAESSHKRYSIVIYGVLKTF